MKPTIAILLLAILGWLALGGSARAEELRVMAKVLSAAIHTRARDQITDPRIGSAYSKFATVVWPSEITTDGTGVRMMSSSTAGSSLLAWQVNAGV